MGRFGLTHTTHRRLVVRAQRLVLVGLSLTVSWNLLWLTMGWQRGWWLGLILPLSGLLGWLIVLPAPGLLAKSRTVAPLQADRLLYRATPDWDERRARQALLTLIHAGVTLEIIWARSGDEIGCWLAAAHHRNILKQLVRDVFPGGLLEESAGPEIGRGVVILHWQPNLNLPEPAQLCQMDGIEGVYFRWRSHSTATVALWGPNATRIAGRWAATEALLIGQGSALRSPVFDGDNPWPELPPFPSPNDCAGLSAISRLERIAPQLRVNGDGPALIIGQDAERQLIGLPLPDLSGLRRLQVFGRAADDVVVDLVQQAIRADHPTFVLDGDGAVATRLVRLLPRQVANDKILLCDVERPAQSKFRLNPLWLPAGLDQAQSSDWSIWLRELGVTTGGLGHIAFRHTLAAVLLAAQASLRRNLLLDPPALREALLNPDFLTTLPPDTLDHDTRQWWLAEGRQTSSFDMHLRLAHLRDRLGALLELPEYRMLWQAPYLNPLTAVDQGQCLLWRLPDPRRRLAAYITSQLLALTTLLAVWPAKHPPLLLFLHEVPLGLDWIKRLQALSTVKLIVSGSKAAAPPAEVGQAAGWLISRLDEVSAGNLQPLLPAGITATDLRRLPANRLILQCGADICTVDLTSGGNETSEE